MKFTTLLKTLTFGLLFSFGIATSYVMADDADTTQTEEETDTTQTEEATPETDENETSDTNSAE